MSPADVVIRMLLSKAGIDKSLERVLQNHLHIIHNARLLAIRQVLPKADIILDLGGINAPLYHMGYAHEFEKLFLIDLPADERHEMYSELKIDGASELGKVSVLYADMTQLKPFDDNSVDLVWSGQSIEHVPVDAAERMVEEAFRVLRPNGCFALDTPNGAVTSLHAQTVGLDVIHPEHFVEYDVETLVRLLESKGFIVESSFGTNHMPETIAHGAFTYNDFVLGAAIHPNASECYSQFHICRKPE